MAQVFWRLATGNPDPKNGKQELHNLTKALQIAFNARNPNFYDNRPSGHGPFTYSPYSLGGGSLSPPRGGKSEVQLKAIGSLPNPRQPP